MQVCVIRSRNSHPASTHLSNANPEPARSRTRRTRRAKWRGASRGRGPRRRGRPPRFFPLANSHPAPPSSLLLCLLHPSPPPPPPSSCLFCSTCEGGNREKVRCSFQIFTARTQTAAVNFGAELSESKGMFDAVGNDFLRFFHYQNVIHTHHRRRDHSSVTEAGQRSTSALSVACRRRRNSRKWRCRRQRRRCR